MFPLHPQNRHHPYNVSQPLSRRQPFTRRRLRTHINTRGAYGHQRTNTTVQTIMIRRLSRRHYKPHHTSHQNIKILFRHLTSSKKSQIHLKHNLNRHQHNNASNRDRGSNRRVTSNQRHKSYPTRRITTALRTTHTKHRTANIRV